MQVAEIWDLDKPGKDFDGMDYTALEIAAEKEKNEVVELLERFSKNPAQTRGEIRAKLGVSDE